MDSWVYKLFFTPGDPNKLTWIGGCLPVLAVRLFYPFLALLFDLIVFVYVFLFRGVSDLSYFFVFVSYHVILPCFCRLPIWTSLTSMVMLVQLIIGSLE
jgi:hypothetical protein